MKKSLCIFISILIFTFAFAENRKGNVIDKTIQKKQEALYDVLSNKTLIQENNKICDAKDQSTPEKLVKTISACESVGRFVDRIPFIFLMTDKFDDLVKPEHSDLSQNLQAMREMTRSYATLQDESFKVNQQYFQLKKTLEHQEILDQMENNDKKILLNSLAQKRDELYEEVILPITYEPLSNIIIEHEEFKALDNSESILIQEMKNGIIKITYLSTKESHEMPIIEINGSFYLGFSY